MNTDECPGTETTQTETCPPVSDCPTPWTDWGECQPVESSESGVRVRSNSVTKEEVPCKCPNTDLPPVPKPSEQNFFGKVKVAIVPKKTALNDVLTDGAAAQDMVKELTDLLGKCCTSLPLFFVHI